MSSNHGLQSTTAPNRYADYPTWLTPPRLEDQELLDQGVGTHADVVANLEDMWRLNLYVGGFSALTTHLYPRILNAQSPVTLVDLGTGSAQTLVAITRWARANGVNIRCTGIEWSARNLAVARQHVADMPAITLLQANAMNLPLLSGGADYVISSLFLHHFSPEQVSHLLRVAYAAARRGIIMTDLVRGWLPIIGFRLVRPFFARSFLTWHDGELSIRRAYTPAELQAIAAAAGLSSATVHPHWPWRMTLVADK